MKISISPHALKPSDPLQLRFPYSNNRSKRIHKKLTKRLGEQVVMVPAIYQLHQQNMIVAHPVFESELYRHFVVDPFNKRYDTNLSNIQRNSK